MCGSKRSHCHFLRDIKEFLVSLNACHKSALPTHRQCIKQEIMASVLGSKDGALMQITKKTLNRAI